jgi:hypothetical protein
VLIGRDVRETKLRPNYADSLENVQRGNLTGRREKVRVIDQALARASRSYLSRPTSSPDPVSGDLRVAMWLNYSVALDFGLDSSSAPISCASRPTSVVLFID